MLQLVLGSHGDDRQQLFDTRIVVQASAQKVVCCPLFIADFAVPGNFPESTLLDGQIKLLLPVHT